MNLNELIAKFLNKTNYLNNNKITALAIYDNHSTNSSSNSDLNVLIIGHLKSAKKRFLIENYTIECNMYNEDEITPYAISTINNQNHYFLAFLNNCHILKGEETFANLRHKISSSIINPQKKLLPPFAMRQLSNYYTELTKSKFKDQFSYYNFLELIRENYSYIHSYSKLNLSRIYDIYTDPKRFANYFFYLPNQEFISVFLSSLNCPFNKREKIIAKLLSELEQDLQVSIISKKDIYSFTDAEIRLYLINLHKLKEYCLKLLVNNHPVKDLVYYCLIARISSFYKYLYQLSFADFNEVLEFSKKAQTNEEKATFLNQLFTMLEKDYQIDYNNYYIKLNLSKI